MLKKVNKENPNKKNVGEKKQRIKRESEEEFRKKREEFWDVLISTSGNA